VNSSFPNIGLLWDIDGTLLNTKGVAAKQLTKSFKDVTAVDCSILPGQYSGFTDFEIVLDLLQKSNLPSNVSLADEILVHYGRRLFVQLNKKPPELLADIELALDKVSKLGHIKQFIGTGNSMLGARAKIAASGLGKYFESEPYFISTPQKISRDSVIRGASQSIRIPTLLIGDSDRDILCAQKNNLKVLAVATGHHKIEDLNRLNPDYSLDSDWKAQDLLEIVSMFKSSVET
jgi:phosphoglycolate phosphatase-like HAD superfamily hydrolase